MKKLIVFLMVTVLSVVSTAAPSNKLNYGKVVGKLDNETPFASFLKSQKNLSGLNFEVRELSDSTLEFKVDGKTIVLEEIDGSRFKINGEVIKVSQNEPAQSVLNKVNRAFEVSSRRVSWIEVLFFPEAKAFFGLGTLGSLVVLGIAGFIAYRIGVNIERNRWIRSALAPRPAVVEETTVTEGLLPAFQ